MDMETEAEVVLPDRNEKHTLPTKVRIMLMLSMAVIPEERRAFRRRFRQASRKDVEGNDMEQKPCATGVSDMCPVQSVGLRRHSNANPSNYVVQATCSPSLELSRNS